MPNRYGKFERVDGSVCNALIAEKEALQDAVRGYFDAQQKIYSFLGSTEVTYSDTSDMFKEASDAEDKMFEIAGLRS